MAPPSSLMRGRLAGAIGLCRSLFFFRCFMMSDRASRAGSRDAMLSCHVASYTAYDGTFRAALSVNSSCE